MESAHVIRHGPRIQPSPHLWEKSVDSHLLLRRIHKNLITFDPHIGHVAIEQLSCYNKEIRHIVM